MDITEKRRYERIKTHIPVKYRKLRGGVNSEGLGSLSRDLSEGGVHFRTDEFISMACRLILELDIPQLPRPVKAISKVAWIKRTEADSENYEVGNQFLEISKKDKEMISEYINSLSMYNNSAVSKSETEQKVETESAS
ncbi:MAG: PilZ domain-containing protein [Candidatus Omnitrophica bacterium]|nr:PilZ domain-containing protein [Candidatus Omnitrophota bacterium]